MTAENLLLTPVLATAEARSSETFLPAFPSRSADSVVLAQQFDQDVLADLGNAFNTFIESGQIWALLIGIVLGYMVRSVTTYN